MYWEAVKEHEQEDLEQLQLEMLISTLSRFI